MNPGEDFSSMYLADSITENLGFRSASINSANPGFISYEALAEPESFTVKQESNFSDYLQQTEQLGPESSLSSYDLSPRKNGQGSPLQKGEKPYVCQICSQAFTQVSNLKRHGRLHTGEKPYSCSQCTKAFSTISNLKQHQQIHESTDERTKFQCQKCMKTYFYQSSLNKHMKTHIKNEMEVDIEKGSKSMSPRKGRPVISTLYHDKSDGSLPSGGSMSDVSPTIKKVKKEKSEAIQLSAATKPNPDEISQMMASKSMIPVYQVGLASNNDYNNPNVPGSNLEEEFKLAYQRNLGKVLNQIPNMELNGIKSIMGLQYLSISGAASGFPQGYNLYNGVQSQPSRYMGQVPDMRYSTNSETYPTHLKIEEPRGSYMVERQQQEPYLPAYQNAGYDFNDTPRPNVFNFLEQDIFGQKRGTIQESFMPNGFPDSYWANHNQNESLISQTNVNDVNTYGTYNGYYNEMADEFVAPVTKKNDGSLNMIDYELENRHEDYSKHIPQGNEFNGNRFF